MFDQIIFVLANDLFIIFYRIYFIDIYFRSIFYLFRRYYINIYKYKRFHRFLYNISDKIQIKLLFLYSIIINCAFRILIHTIYIYVYIYYYRAAILAISAYLEAFQKIADAATNARGKFQ